MTSEGVCSAPGKQSLTLATNRFRQLTVTRLFFDLNLRTSLHDEQKRFHPVHPDYQKLSISIFRMWDYVSTRLSLQAFEASYSFSVVYLNNKIL